MFKLRDHCLACTVCIRGYESPSCIVIRIYGVGKVDIYISEYDLGFGLSFESSVLIIGLCLRLGIALYFLLQLGSVCMVRIRLGLELF